MTVIDLPLAEIDLSQHNVRKNLIDGEVDSGIADLANSIEKQGLLSPITVFRKENGRYAVIAGQRRLLAMKHLGRQSIDAVVRETMSDGEATAISLVENVHRADMNPRDKATAFKVLLDRFGSMHAVSKETGVSALTIKKYIQLLDLAPELQERLAAGESTATTAMAKLAQTVSDPVLQVQVFDKISGFTQEQQVLILRNVGPELENLEELVDQTFEGVFDKKVVRDCPWDCSNIPRAIKQQVANLIEAHEDGQSNKQRIK